MDGLPRVHFWVVQGKGTEMESQALATTCEPRSQHSEQPSKSQLIREWILNLALNAGQALDADAIGIFTAIWLKGFDDLPYSVLEAAFLKTLQTCKYWPVQVSDVRKHVTHAEENAVGEAAEQAWARVLDIRRRHWNPDIPGPLHRVLATLSERVRQAVRAAGVFREFTAAEFESGALHTWAKKRFVESFIAYGELERDKFLLPDGEIKALLVGVAKRKALPAPAVVPKQLPPPANATIEPKKESTLSDLSPEAAAERYAELSRQAEAIVAKYGAQP
jgi:hypothetical protein